jgi:hypothetical protein
MIAIPSPEQLREATQSFEQDWGGVDELLYRLCRDAPGHADRRTVTAKLALVGRVYSAGLERCVSPPKGTQAITMIADWVHAHGDDVDAIVERLPSLAEPLTAAAMERIVVAHAELLALLSKIPTNGKTPRSFAAKYLHFHCPVVPIYDSYAAARLIKLVPLREIAEPQGADVEYCDFCVRFWSLYEACRDADLTVTVKSLDTWLWQVPKTG